MDQRSLKGGAISLRQTLRPAGESTGRAAEPGHAYFNDSLAAAGGWQSARTCPATPTPTAAATATAADAGHAAEDTRPNASEALPLFLANAVVLPGKGGRKALWMQRKVCNNCGSVGHIAGMCKEDKQCHCCGSVQHEISDCPKREESCTTCGKVGHLRTKCRMETQKLVDKTCNNCGTMGHIAKDCPCPAECHCCGATVHEIATCPHREKTCENCGKVGHLKKKCRQDKENEPPLRGKGSTKGKGKGNSAGKMCKNCGVQGHLLRDCHEPSQCHCCGSTVHAVAECPNREKSCELCGKTGHLKKKSQLCGSELNLLLERRLKLDLMLQKARRKSCGRAFGAWKSHVALLRQALAQQRRSVLAAAFSLWKEQGAEALKEEFNDLWLKAVLLAARPLKSEDLARFRVFPVFSHFDSISKPSSPTCRRPGG
eukprot:s1573_g4.t2